MSERTALSPPTDEVEAVIHVSPELSLYLAQQYHECLETAVSSDDPMHMATISCQFCGEQTRWSKQDIVNHVKEHVSYWKSLSTQVDPHPQSIPPDQIRRRDGRFICDVEMKPATACDRMWFCAATFATYTELTEHWQDHLEAFKINRLPVIRPSMLSEGVYLMVPYDPATESWVLSKRKRDCHYRPVDRVFNSSALPLHSPNLFGSPAPAPAAFTLWREVAIPTEHGFGAPDKYPRKPVLDRSSKRPCLEAQRGSHRRTLGARSVIGTPKAKCLGLQPLKLPDPRIIARRAGLLSKRRLSRGLE